MKLQLTAFIILFLFGTTIKAFAQIKELPDKIGTTNYGAHLKRSMHLLTNTSIEERIPIKVLFFGQSIIATPYIKETVENDLRQRFPNADITIEHDAVGGFTAQKLVKTAYHMVYPRYPDLIIFHCYSGEYGEFEQIIKDIQAQTTAEVMTWTHHVDNLSAQVDGEREFGSQVRRDLAKEHNIEIAEVREQWKRYLSKHNLEKNDLLVSDQIHINEHGGTLIGSILNRHLVGNIANPNEWEDKVQTIKAPSIISDKGYAVGEWNEDQSLLTGTTKDSRVVFKFHGNRIDVGTIPSGNSFGSADILIDGKKPSDFIGNWANTLPSKLQYYNRPGIMKVDFAGSKPFAEKWTLTVLEVSPDGKMFRFNVKGSVSGDQGEGDHTKTFVSENGIISIKPENFSFFHAYQLKALPNAPFEITWDTYNTSIDVWQPTARTDSYKINRNTIAKGLDNGEHVIELLPRGDGDIPITELVVYRPLLNRENETQEPSLNLLEPVISSNEIELKVDINDPEGKISKVTYYEGNSFIGESLSAPFSYKWENVSQGNKQVKAIATYNNFNFSISQTISININSESIQKFVIEAESWHQTVVDKGINDIKNSSSDEASSGEFLNMFDLGDKIEIPINIGVELPITVRVNARLRSGDLNANDNFWPDGYFFALNGESLNLTGETASISPFTNAMGGSYWGSMVSEEIIINSNKLAIEITSNKNWAAIDFIELELIGVESNTMVVGITDLIHDYDGLPKQPTIKAFPENTPIEITYNGNSEPPSESGNYQVRVASLDDNINAEIFETLKIKGPNSIASEEFSNNIFIHPNPTRDKIVIEDYTRQFGAASIKLFNSIGQLIESKVEVENFNKFSINLSDKKSGIYLLHYQKGDKIGIKKLLKI